MLDVSLLGVKTVLRLPKDALVNDRMTKASKKVSTPPLPEHSFRENGQPPPLPSLLDGVVRCSKRQQWRHQRFFFHISPPNASDALR